MDNLRQELNNIKSFLQVYNRITEVCFQACVDNLSTRQCSTDEDKCVDNCFRKFSNVNQRLLATYVEQQAEVNRRRAAELEALERQAQQAQAAAAAAAATTDTPSIPVQSESYIAPEDVSMTLGNSETSTVPT